MALRHAPMTLILASASPRRKELLSSLGLSFEVHPAEVDETPRAGERPRAYVRRVAQEKAAAIARLRAGSLVLAADTSVVVGQEILGKPVSEAQARAMLRKLSGRAHTVLSAVALAGSHEASVVVSTTVHFRPLGPKEIAWYVSTGEPMDKAGAYAVQGKGGVLVGRLVGSHSNVIGLPLVETMGLLHEAGFPLPWSMR